MSYPVPSPLRLIASAVLTVALLGVAAAQQTRPLAELAPRETVLAVGWTDVTLPEGDLHEALGELDWQGAARAWEALVPVLDELGGELGDLTGAFGAAGALAGGAAGGLGDDLGSDAVLAELDAACPGLADALTVLGEDGRVAEALLTVSMDAFAPFPAGLLAVRTDAAAGDAAGTVHDRLVACFAEDTAGSQDGTTLHVLGDGSDLPLVLARRDDLIVIGTRPDVVRGALRAEAGAGDRSFADAPVGAAMSELGPGLRLALQTTVLGDLLETRVPSFGGAVGEVAGDRAVAALRTFGGAALRLGAGDAGWTVESLVAFDPAGGDDALATLLACDGCRASGPFLAPRDAVAVSGRVWRPEAWFDYLDGWVRDLSAADGDPTDLRTLLREETGVDVDPALLDWVGREVQTVRLEPLSTDLRDLLLQPPAGLVMPVASAEAAEEGLVQLASAFASLYERLAAEDDDLPDDLDGLVSIRDAEVDGVAYRRVRVGPNYEAAVGTIGNRLVIASPASAFATFVAVERGDARNGFGSDGWRSMRDEAGERDLSAWAYGDGGADLRGVAELVDLVAQPLAFVAATALDAALDAAREGPASDDPFGGFDGFDDGPEPVDVAGARRYDRAEVDAAGATGLAVPGEAQGRLGATGATAAGKVVNLYRLDGLVAGETYTVEMTSQPIDTYLYLIDADAGAFIAENDDAPFTDRSAIAFVADGATDLLVGASSWSGSDTGPYTLRVSEGTVDAPDPFAFGADTAPVDVATVEGYGTVATRGPMPTPVTPPLTVERELSSTSDAATYLNDDLVDLYRLDGLAAGDELTVEMTSDEFDTYLYLVDGDAGRILHENDDSPSTDRSEIRLVADGRTGLVVAAGSWSGTAEGAYTLTLERANEAPADAAEEGAEVGADGSPDPGMAPPADPSGPQDDAAEAGGAADRDADAAEGDERAGAASDDVPAPEAPTFDDLLTLFDVAAGVLAEVGERLGTYASFTAHEDGRLHTVHEQAFDW